MRTIIDDFKDFGKEPKETLEELNEITKRIIKEEAEKVSK